MERVELLTKSKRSIHNTQLFEDASGIYLVGTGINRKGAHTADVFHIDAKVSKYDMMTKVRSQRFSLPSSVSFRNGAGFVQDGDKLSLWTVGKHLKPHTSVAVFPSEK